jgi:hypothetical protein
MIESTNMIRKRETKDPMNPISTKIFLLFRLSEIFPQRISATTDEREESDAATPTMTTPCLK